MSGAAELDASGNELIPAVEAQKNVLTLEEAKRRLAQLEEDVKSRAATNQASLAVVQEKRNKAMLGMQRAQQLIDSLVLKAPMDGTVSIKENRDGINFFGPGMVIPEYREGDSVWPGRPVADVMESGKMEVRAKIAESDRANLTAGQPAVVVSRHAARRELRRDRSARSPALRAARSGSRARRSRASSTSRFQFDKPDPRLKAGASARVTIQGKEIPDALHVPRQAVLEKNGKTHVFVKIGDRFEQREVKVEQPDGEPRGNLRHCRRHRGRAHRPDGRAPDVEQQLADASCRRRRRARSWPPPASPARHPTSCPSCASGSRTCARTSCDRS